MSSELALNVVLPKCPDASRKNNDPCCVAVSVSFEPRAFHVDNDVAGKPHATLEHEAIWNRRRHKSSQIWIPLPNSEKPHPTLSPKEREWLTCKADFGQSSRPGLLCQGGGVHAEFHENVRGFLNFLFVWDTVLETGHMRIRLTYHE
jgi:hypothetical protein